MEEEEAGERRGQETGQNDGDILAFLQWFYVYMS